MDVDMAEKKFDFHEFFYQSICISLCIPKHKMPELAAQILNKICEMNNKKIVKKWKRNRGKLPPKQRNQVLEHQMEMVSLMVNQIIQ